MKSIVCNALVGFLAGVGVEHIVVWVTSVIMRTGYYYACFSAIPERVGGELNGVLLQAGVFGAAGLVIGVLLACRKRRKPNL